jgi:hypothetical protein
MTWGFAAIAASAAMNYASGVSAANSSIRSANSASRAEGEAIAKERINTTVRNSYNTAFAQLQLGLQKRQLSQQSADISAAGLAALGDAQAVAAATGSIGASTDAVMSDINMNLDAAQQQVQDAWENTQTNYNNELDMMVLNTDASAPTVRPVEYTGPSSGQLLAQSVAGAFVQAASSYAMKKAQLGLGSSTGNAGASRIPSTTGTNWQSLFD